MAHTYLLLTGGCTLVVKFKYSTNATKLWLNLWRGMKLLQNHHHWQGPRGLGLAWILQNRKQRWQRRHSTQLVWPPCLAKIGRGGPVLNIAKKCLEISSYFCEYRNFIRTQWGWHPVDELELVPKGTHFLNQKNKDTKCWKQPFSRTSTSKDAVVQK